MSYLMEVYRFMLKFFTRRPRSIVSTPVKRPAPTPITNLQRKPVNVKVVWDQPKDPNITHQYIDVKVDDKIIISKKLAAYTHTFSFQSKPRANCHISITTYNNDIASPPVSITFNI